MRQRTELMESILTNKTAQRIIDWVSPIYGNSYVGLWIFQAIGIVFDEIYTIADQLRYETNFLTADMLLDMWEKQFGIATDSSLTLEERRARILAQKLSRGASNPERIRAAVSAALGGAEVEITENVSKNKFVVTVLEQIDSIVPAVAVIERMKPAHLIYELRVTEYTVTNAELKAAVALTHTEKFTVPAVKLDIDLNDRVYVSGNTLVMNNYGAYATGETMVMPSAASVDGETLIVE